MILGREVSNEIRESLAKRAKARGMDGDVGMFGVRFTKIEVKSEQKGYELDGVATSDMVDCDDEVVLPDGVMWDKLNKYKTLYVDHQYGVRHAAATLRNVVRKENRWRVQARLLPDDYSEDIPRLRVLASEGMLGMSIGFLALDRSAPTPEERKRYPGCESVIRKADVFEVSFTAMPCNLSCRASLASVSPETAGKVMELVAKGMLPEAYRRACQAPRKTLVLV